MQGKHAGIVLIVAGAFLLMRETEWQLYKYLSTWEFLLILTGLIVLFLSMRQPHHPNLMIWGGITLGLGIHAWGLSHVKEWPQHWSLVPAIIGACFFLIGGLLKKDRKKGTIGAILLLLGLFAWPGANRIPGVGEAAVFMNTYWPTLLILLGIFLLWKK
ncbi:LiaI-LiaF-like domain-containing protein [Paludifilum halophilum]|uniref:Uncharacterized protein n=1 Tax=Paludifilum halophilum TaxID=1642702 RepID=A0A235B8T9_9BACL|nr:DUF5668 domain-containing protein [Paludifilum halophilum]OYD08287.1 hypothetical protein CHM34_05390 [Paludifilum halophilum]